MSLFFVSLSLHLDTNPVEALDFLLLVLPLFAEGQQLILQVANLLLQLCGLRVEALFLPLKHTAKTPKIPHFYFCILVLLDQHHVGPLSDSGLREHFFPEKKGPQNCTICYYGNILCEAY